MTGDTPPTQVPPVFGAVTPWRTSGLAIASLALGLVSLTSIVLLVTAVFGLVGLPLGIVAVVKIARSDGALRGTGLAIGGIVASCVGVLIAVLALALIAPAISEARTMADELRYQAQARELAMALAFAAADDEGRYPEAETWGRVLEEANLVGDLATIRTSPKGDSQLAFNASMAGIRDLDLATPERTVLLFEARLGVDAGGLADVAATDPVVIVTADGRVQEVPAADLPAYLWAPEPATPDDE